MKYLVLILATLSFGKMSFASDLGNACKADSKKFACKTDTDQALHECLEKHEKKGKKYPTEGFTKACYEANEAFEKQNDKEEEHK